VAAAPGASSEITARSLVRGDHGSARRARRRGRSRLHRAVARTRRGDAEAADALTPGRRIRRRTSRCERRPHRAAFARDRTERGRPRARAFHGARAPRALAPPHASQAHPGPWHSSDGNPARPFGLVLLPRLPVGLDPPRGWPAHVNRPAPVVLPTGAASRRGSGPIHRLRPAPSFPATRLPALARPRSTRFCLRLVASVSRVEGRTSGMDEQRQRCGGDRVLLLSRR
jgi:hypothetical protein